MIHTIAYPVLAFVAGICCKGLYAQTPDVRIEVNKEYDKDGNILRYDSVRSYSYGFGNPGETNFFDSLFRHFGFFDHQLSPGTLHNPRQEAPPPQMQNSDPFEHFRELMELQRQFMNEIMHNPPCRRKEQKPCCPGSNAPTTPSEKKQYSGQKSEL